MEWESTLREIEDYLFPRLQLTIRQRALYYHLLRHTRVIDSENKMFAIAPLARALDIGDSTVREDLRDLHKKGCIKIEDRTRTGHLVRVLLPTEIDGVLPDIVPANTIDIESLDFFSNRQFVEALLLREQGRCFYCLRSLRKETCELDHVTPQVAEGGNSYRNIVAACHECNSHKQGADGADFIRALYRRGVLSQAELEVRLGAIEELKAGHLIPPIEAA